MNNDGWGNTWDNHNTTPIVNVGVAIAEIQKFNSSLDAIKVYNNLSPTHDPYTNPDSQIYYECSCGAILDPGTKSFASLNNHASDKGWKIRFSDQGYTPYCVKCGQGVE